MNAADFVARQERARLDMLQDALTLCRNLVNHAFARTRSGASRERNDPKSTGEGDPVVEAEQIYRFFLPLIYVSKYQIQT